MSDINPIQSTDANHPPVPPTDSVRLAEHEKTVRSGVIERSACETPCIQCGATVYYKVVRTGRVIVDMWDATDFDSDQYDLSAERAEIERYQECDRCGWRVYV